MRKLRGTAIAAVLTSMSLIAAGSATAATEVGNHCTATTGLADFTGIPISQAPGSPLPLTVPTAGVVTQWRTSLPEVPTPVSMQLKVFRSTPNPKQFQVVGESEIGAAKTGANSFNTKISVEAGDRFGTYGAGPTGGTLFCETGNAADVVAVAPGGSGVGSTQTFPTEDNKAAVAVSATVEPDADRDGYGDETQDKCPQSAAVQVACPILILDAVSQTPGKNSVKILVASSSDSTITVSASAKLGGKSNKARVSSQAKLAPISQLVTPGKIATYTMNFTKKLKDELKSLPRKKSVKLTVTATGNSVSGAASSDKLTVKLKGQG